MKYGDFVKLIGTRNHDSKYYPRWDGRHGRVVGRIVGFTSRDLVAVSWSNGNFDYFDPEEIEVINSFIQPEHSHPYTKIFK